MYQFLGIFMGIKQHLGSDEQFLPIPIVQRRKRLLVPILKRGKQVFITI